MPEHGAALPGAGRRSLAGRCQTRGMDPRRRLMLARRLGSCIAGLCAVLATFPGTAAAHGGTDDATNYSSRVNSPGDPGLSWTVEGGDSLLELTNATGRAVVVSGYQGEPYLEFRADDTVWVNTRSPAHHLNTTRYATTPLPPEADAAAEPTWELVASDATHAWHDHRIHWMSPLVPQGVDADPTVDQRILSWSIPVSVAGSATEATGELWWIAPEPWWPPVVVPGVVLLLAALAVVLRSGPVDEGSRWPAASRPVVVLLGVVGAANVVRVVDDIVASRASTGEQVAIVIGTTASLAAIAALLRPAWRGTGGGHLALVGAGLATMLIFGGEATDMLTASQITTELPVWIRRWTVGLSYAAIVPVTVVALAAGRHFARLERIRRLGVEADPPSHESHAHHPADVPMEMPD